MHDAVKKAKLIEIYLIVMGMGMTRATSRTMEEAWRMTTAHREELVRRSPAPVIPVALPAPAPPAVPRVLAMLQGGI